MIVIDRTKTLAAAVASLVALVVLTGCTIPPPPGAAPLRYRDAIFTTVNVTSDLTYGSAPDNDGNPVALKLDMYRPAGDTVARRPAVVYVHGGGFSRGDKAAGANSATYFAKRGYVAVSINYRLLAPVGCGGEFDPTPACQAGAYAAQHDAQAAVRWLRANAATYGIDSERIAMAGSSAGAITSLLSAWRPEDPGNSGNPGYSSRIAAAASISGGIPSNEFITPGDAPVVFFHGTEDRTVFYSWAAGNAAAMQRTGLAVIFESFEGAGHGLGKARYGPLIQEQSNYFFYNFLDLGHAGGQTAAAARASTAYMKKMGKRYPRYAPAARRQLARFRDYTRR